MGGSFTCEGQTELVSRQGAKIVVKQALAPDQQIQILCLETGKEAAARVVGCLDGKARLSSYGIALADSESNPWGIDFPERGDSAAAVGRIVLECLACHSRELSYLGGFELEALEVNGAMTRYCRRCSESSSWKKSFDPVPPSQAASDQQRAPEEEQRTERRHNLRIIACVKSSAFGDDLVKTRNVSRNGLCFESRHAYAQKTELQVAIPYSSGGGNIFVPARIVRIQTLSEDGLGLYGLLYIRKVVR